MGFLLFHRIWCWSATFWEVWHSPLGSMPLQMSMKVNVLSPESPRLAVFSHFTAVQSSLFGRFPIWQTPWFNDLLVSVPSIYLCLFITYTSPGQAPVCHSKCFTWKICCLAFQRKHWEVDLEVHNVNRWNIGDICVHILRQTWILWWWWWWWCFLVSSDLGSWDPQSWKFDF